MNATAAQRAMSTWAFGGPLADAPAEAAWSVLLFVAAVFALLAWISYRNSITRVRLVPALCLTLLRTGTVVGLLYCIANPTIIERYSTKPPAPPPPPPLPSLAVVVDRSDSMTLKDNRGRSRLDDALGNWRRIEKTATSHFGRTDYYSFGHDFRPAKSLDEALTRTGGTQETRLYTSIVALLKQTEAQRPDAVVVLTDGVDTTNDSEATLREAAVAAGIPVYFVPGTNRSARPDPFLRVREWRIPPTVSSNTEVTLEAAFEAFSRADRVVPFTLWMGSRRLFRGELSLTTGPNLVTRSFAVTAGEPGPVEFSLRLGEGDEAPLAARAVMQVLPERSKKIRVLIHQSALDWGLRYFTGALKTDPTFEFYTMVTPDVGVTVQRKTDPGSLLVGRLPETLKPLEQFDSVVLIRPWPRRITTAQQEALVEFARKGGAVFFLSPDHDAMEQFAEAPMRALLPVYLEGEQTPASGNVAQNAPSARRTGGPAAAPGPTLKAFELTEAGRASPAFMRAGSAGGGFLQPRFLDYVPVGAPKPGAEVLATYATPANGRRDILLATQRFGQGRAVLLTTDTLWRWKLDEPSSSRAVETFWQQLLLAMGRHAEPQSLRFSTAPAQLRVGQAVTLTLGGVASDKSPVVVVKGPTAKTTPLIVTTTNDPENPWSIEWTPDQPGAWEIHAGIEGAYRASIFPSVIEDVKGELARSVTAIDAMRTLAGETGGQLLTHEAPAAWRGEKQAEPEPQMVLNERRTALWNTWTVLWITLGIYCAELVLRRLLKLL